MAEITRVGIPAVLSVLTLAANRISGSPAGDAADVRGFATTEAESGRAVSLAFDVTMRYGEGLPEDRNLYLSGAVPGGLADAPSPGGTRPVAFVVDATRIHVLQS